MRNGKKGMIRILLAILIICYSVQTGGVLAQADFVAPPAGTTQKFSNGSAKYWLEDGTYLYFPSGTDVDKAIAEYLTEKQERIDKETKEKLKNKRKMKVKEVYDMVPDKELFLNEGYRRLWVRGSKMYLENNVLETEDLWREENSDEYKLIWYDDIDTKKTTVGVFRFAVNDGKVTRIEASGFGNYKKEYEQIDGVYTVPADGVTLDSVFHEVQGLYLKENDSQYGYEFKMVDGEPQLWDIWDGEKTRVNLYYIAQKADGIHFAGENISKFVVDTSKNFIYDLDIHGKQIAEWRYKKQVKQETLPSDVSEQEAFGDDIYITSLNVEGVSLEHSQEELIQMKDFFSEDEKKIINNGTSVKVWLETGDFDITSVTVEEKQKVRETVNREFGETGKIVFFDVELMKQVGNSSVKSVHEPGDKICVTVDMPAEIETDIASNGHALAIIRIHEEQVDLLDCEYNKNTGKITFYTDKFSVYGIVYSSKELSTSAFPMQYIGIGIGIIVVGALTVGFFISKKRKAKNV